MGTGTNASQPQPWGSSLLSCRTARPKHISNIEALIITNTFLFFFFWGGAPYYNYSIIYLQTPFKLLRPLYYATPATHGRIYRNASVHVRAAVGDGALQRMSKWGSL